MWCSQCGNSVTDEAAYCTACGACVRVRSAASPAAPQRSQTKYRGLGGWLVLVGLGLIGSPILFAAIGYQTAVLFSDGTVRLLSDPAAGIHVAGYSSALRFELVGQTLASLGSAYALCLYFLRSRLFPTAYITFQLALLGFYVVDWLVVMGLAGRARELKEVLDQEVNAMGPQLVGTAVGALLWVAYMLKSQRVRATFVE